MFPFPTGLGQVLDAYALIHSGAPMSRAFQAAASRRRVTPSTIRSACTRNLGLSSAEFQALASPGRERDFRRFMVSRYPLLSRQIGEFLDSLPIHAHAVAEEPAAYGQPARVCAQDVADVLIQWSANQDIPPHIRTQMQQLASTLGKYHLKL